jgi:hypothetical protein
MDWEENINQMVLERHRFDPETEYLGKRDSYERSILDTNHVNVVCFCDILPSCLALGGDVPGNFSKYAD